MKMICQGHIWAWVLPAGGPNFSHLRIGKSKDDARSNRHETLDVPATVVAIELANFLCSFVVFLLQIIPSMHRLWINLLK